MNLEEIVRDEMVQLGAIKYNPGDFVRYNSGNVLVVMNERDSGAYEVKSLIIGKNTNSIIRYAKDLRKIKNSNISICPECLKFIDKEHSDMVQCESCSSYLHRSHQKNHACSDSYPLPVLLKLNSLLDEIGLKSPSEFSSFRGSIISGAPEIEEGLEVDSFLSSKIIKISDIYDGIQHRFELNEFHADKLSKLFLKQGHRDPIIILQKIVDGETRYIIEDGHHRLAAAKLLGWSNIRAYVIDTVKSDFEQKLDAYRSNASHLDYTELERAVAISEIFADAKVIDPELSLAKFARDVIEEPYSTVYDDISLAGLHHNIHRLMRDPDNPLPKTTALLYKKLSMEDQDIFFENYSDIRDRAILKKNINLWLEASPDFRTDLINGEHSWYWLETELGDLLYNEFRKIIDEIDSKYSTDLYDVDRSPFRTEFINNLVELIILEFEDYISISAESSFIKEFRQDHDLEKLWKIIDQKVIEANLATITISISTTLDGKFSQDAIDDYIQDAKNKLKIEGNLDVDEYIDNILTSLKEAENEVSDVSKDDLREMYSKLFNKSIDYILSCKDQKIKGERLSDTEETLYQSLESSMNVWNELQKSGTQYSDADIAKLKEIYDMQKAAYAIFEKSDEIFEFSGMHDDCTIGYNHHNHECKVSKKITKAPVNLYEKELNRKALGSLMEFSSTHIVKANCNNCDFGINDKCSNSDPHNKDDCTFSHNCELLKTMNSPGELAKKLKLSPDLIKNVCKLILEINDHDVNDVSIYASISDLEGSLAECIPRVLNDSRAGLIEFIKSTLVTSDGFFYYLRGWPVTEPVTLEIDELHSIDFQLIRIQVDQLSQILNEKYNLTKALQLIEQNIDLMLKETKKILLYKKRGAGLLKQPANEKKHEIMKCNLVKLLKNDILEKYKLVDELESRVVDQAIQFSLIVIPDIENSKVTMVPWIAPGAMVSNMYWDGNSRIRDTYPEFDEVFMEVSL